MFVCLYVHLHMHVCARACVCCACVCSACVCRKMSAKWVMTLSLIRQVDRCFLDISERALKAEGKHLH